MPDNITTPLNNGTVLAADEVNGVLYPRTKISYGTDGLATDVSVSNPMPSRDTAVKDAIDALAAKNTVETILGAVRDALTGRLLVDTVVRSAPVDRGRSVGTSAVDLLAANPTRRGFCVQNQSETATVYFNVSGTAASSVTSLQLLPGAYFESSPVHSGVGAVSIISTEANTPVYAKEW